MAVPTTPTLHLALTPNRFSPKTPSSIPSAVSLHRTRRPWPTQLSLASSMSAAFSSKPSSAPFPFFSCSASSHDETLVTDDETDAVADESQPQVEDSKDTITEDDNSSPDDDSSSIEESLAPILASLQSYKEAVVNNDESKIGQLETHFKSIEDEKIGLERQLLALSDELSVAKDRVLRISADFDNFRKRTERERASLVTNAQGEVIENLLPVLDNFERAKAQIKVEGEKEEKINNSYQSIYKQFVEVLGSLGVVPVETVGKPFDPLLHEAIMREESTEFEEGVVVQEFRKGFAVGERLLRPSMVKVSAGPGPENTAPVSPSGPEGTEAGPPELVHEPEGADGESDPEPTLDE